MSNPVNYYLAKIKCLNNKTQTKSTHPNANPAKVTSIAMIKENRDFFSKKLLQRTVSSKNQLHTGINNKIN